MKWGVLAPTSRCCRGDHTGYLMKALVPGLTHNELGTVAHGIRTANTGTLPVSLLSLQQEVALTPAIRFPLSTEASSAPSLGRQPQPSQALEAVARLACCGCLGPCAHSRHQVGDTLVPQSSVWLPVCHT